MSKNRVTGHSITNPGKVGLDRAGNHHYADHKPSENEKQYSGVNAKLHTVTSQAHPTHTLTARTAAERRAERLKENGLKA
jgi:ribosomal protein L35